MQHTFKTRDEVDQWFGVFAREYSKSGKLPDEAVRWYLGIFPQTNEEKQEHLRFYIDAMQAVVDRIRSLEKEVCPAEPVRDPHETG